MMLVSSAVLAQEPEKKQVPQAKTQSISDLKMMAGDWNGTGWIIWGRERKTFSINETLSFKLGGALLVVEGLGREMIDGKVTDKIIHQAYGVFKNDPDSGGVGFRFYKENGNEGFTLIKVDGMKVEWGFTDPASGSEIIFKESYSEDGVWEETGEVKPKGSERWIQFFYMKLTKK